MRTLLGSWSVFLVVGAVVLCAGIATAAPKSDAAGSPLKRALAFQNAGFPDKALAAIEEGLAVDAKNLPLLDLKGSILLAQPDYSGALTTYQAVIDAGATGKLLRKAQIIVASLEPVKTTFLDITLANGPATIYVGAKSNGVFCTASPTCEKRMLPGGYKVIADRPGFAPWTGRVTVVKGEKANVAITLVEKPSQLTVRATPADASVAVDGSPYDPRATITAGAHQVVVTLAGHAAARHEVVAHEGKPVELDVTLAPVVPIRVAPQDATLLLDDKPVAVEDGGIPVPAGAHRLVARAQGFKESRIEIPAERVAGYELTVDLPRVIPPPPPLPPPSPWTPRRKVALATAGLGVAGAAAGVVLGLQAKKLDRDAFASCPSPSTPCSNAEEANDLNKRGRSRALQANVAYGVAAGAAVATAVLWFTGGPEGRVAVTPQVATRSGGTTGLDIAVRF
jgi:hypothetical protein